MYVKFVRDTLRSSLNDTPISTRWVFVSCCLMADWNGFFVATLSGIAREANCTMDQAKEAMDILQAPDPDSTTPDDDGVRVRYLGHNHWHVVNIKKYRAADDLDHRRELDAERQRRHRDTLKSTVTVTTPSRDSNVTSRHIDKDIDQDPDRTTEQEQDARDKSPAVDASQVEPDDGEKTKPPRTPKPKPNIDKRVMLDVQTWQFSGITEADRAQWAGYAPGIDIDRELAAFVDYMQTHPEQLQRTIQTGAWKAALNTRFRNVARYGGQTQAPARAPKQEREYASAIWLREQAAKKAREVIDNGN